VASISVDSVSKRYLVYAPDRPTTLKSAVISGFRQLRHRESFWALRDISFDVERGQTLAIVGPNGAGKSTLLRLIGGVGRPDTGTIACNGRLGALLDLGAGFHPDLTGRESIRLGCVIAGLSRSEAERVTQDIAAFAEVADFLDNPIRTYSSGMQARLGFAIAAHTDPDIVLIDEALAVGDLAFQRRCRDRIEAFKGSGAAIVIVSHDPDEVAALADEVIWLRAGRIAAKGSPADVVNRYRSHMSDRAWRSTPGDLATAYSSNGVVLKPGENRFGTQEASIRAVRLRNRRGDICEEVLSGEGFEVDLELELAADVGSFNVSASLTRSDGLLCLDSTTQITGCGADRRTVRLQVARIDLAPGSYTVDVGAYSDDWETVFDYHYGVYPLLVRGAAPTRAVTAPPMTWVELESHQDDVAETEARLRTPG
jgi:lipopolysaccharide transport system ATP-binding protein